MLYRCNPEDHRRLYDKGEDICTNCGEELTARNTKLKMKSCPNCESKTPIGRERCSGCGYIFNPEKRKVAEKPKRERRTKVKFNPDF